MKLAVSSWALHRTLGTTFPDSPATGPSASKDHAPDGIALSDLPRELSRRGYSTVELCHFHIPSTDSSALTNLKQAFADQGVTIQSLLIDDGDPSDSEFGARDAEWIGKWVDAASTLGAQRARVIAGKSSFGREAFERAVGHLVPLAQRAESQGVRLTTENWFPLMASPEAVLELLDRAEGKIGLCADFGNWDAPRKYRDLPEIFGRAETCHAKCDFEDAETIDMSDYGQCIDIARRSEFEGVYVMVNGGPADEWRALELTSKALISQETVGR